MASTVEHKLGTNYGPYLARDLCAVGQMVDDVGHLAGQLARQLAGRGVQAVESVDLDMVDDAGLDRVGGHGPSAKALGLLGCGQQGVASVGGGFWVPPSDDLAVPATPLGSDTRAGHGRFGGPDSGVRAFGKPGERERTLLQQSFGSAFDGADPYLQGSVSKGGQVEPEPAVINDGIAGEHPAGVSRGTRIALHKASGRQ